MSNAVAKLEVDTILVAGCGTLPKSVSEKHVFLYILGNQKDWGPNTNGKFDIVFDRLGF